MILTTGYTAPTTPDTKDNPYTTNVTLTKGVCLVMVEVIIGHWDNNGGLNLA